MNQKYAITGWQLMLIVITANISTTVLFVPTELVAIAKQDGWIACVFGTILAACLVFYPLAVLGEQYSQKTIVQYSEDIMGKILGKVFGLLFIYYFFQIYAWTIREFGELSIVIIPETPMIVFIIIMAILASYAAYCGIEVIGRCSEFVFPLGIVSLALIIILNIFDMNINNIFPFMENGILTILRAAQSPFEWLANGFVFGMLTVFVNKTDKKKLKKFGIYLVVLGGTILIIFSIINIMVFGAVTGILNFPLLELARYTKTVVLFERIESIIIMIWISWVFLRSAIFLFAATYGIAQFFNLKDYRVYIIPVSILAVSYSIYQYDSFAELSYLFGIAHFYYLSFNFGLPFLLYIVYLIRFTSRRNFFQKL